MDSKQVDTKTLQLNVHGMTCASCVNTIESHLKSLACVRNASVNLLSETATVDIDPQANIRSILEAVEDVGFSATLK